MNPIVTILVFLLAGLFANSSLEAQKLQQDHRQRPASLVSLAATGEKMSFFLGLSNTSPFSVVTQPAIRRAEDLKGKKIGTARFGGSSHISALIALEHLGLDLKRDKITLIQTGVRSRPHGGAGEQSHRRRHAAAGRD